jgi:hypothetical protein
MSSSDRFWRNGIAVGLIAYASVAVFYSAFDFLAARGLFNTVDLLGKAVFRGHNDPSVLLYPIQPDVTAIFLYNALHLVLSVLIGLIVVRFIAEAERNPGMSSLILFMIAAGFAATVLIVGSLTSEMRAVLPWWSIVVANGLATIVAGFYLLRDRPGLLSRLLPHTSLDFEDHGP